jgi:hypothetical protein
MRLRRVVNDSPQLETLPQNKGPPQWKLFTTSWLTSVRGFDGSFAVA